MKYEEKTLLDIIGNTYDPYMLSKVMHIIELSYFLINNLSQTTDSQKEIIISGIIFLSDDIILGWGIMGLRQLFSNDTKNYKLLKTLFNLEELQAFVINFVKLIKCRV